MVFSSYKHMVFDHLTSLFTILLATIHWNVKNVYRALAFTNITFNCFSFFFRWHFIAAVTPPWNHLEWRNTNNGSHDIGRQRRHQLDGPHQLGREGHLAPGAAREQFQSEAQESSDGRTSVSGDGGDPESAGIQTQNSAARVVRSVVELFNFIGPLKGLSQLFVVYLSGEAAPLRFFKKCFNPF